MCQDDEIPGRQAGVVWCLLISRPLPSVSQSTPRLFWAGSQVHLVLSTACQALPRPSPKTIASLPTKHVQSDPSKPVSTREAPGRAAGCLFYSAWAVLISFPPTW